MPHSIRDEEYQALAELRFRIRQFLRGSDESARAAGLEPQQFQMLLAIRGLNGGEEATIRRLADRLFLRHHSAVELIDRLEAHGYIRRSRSREDRRRVLVSLLPQGERALEDVARHRLDDLRASGHALVAALEAILKRSSHMRPGKSHRRASAQGKNRRIK